MRRHRPRLHRSNPRVRIHDIPGDDRRDRYGRATVAGLNYQDLSSMMTCAALWCHQERDKDPPDQPHHAQLLRLIDLVTKRIKRAIGMTHRSERTPTTRAERWATVREERRTRILIDQLIREHFEKREATP